jgi:predicted ester cyclase
MQGGKADVLDEICAPGFRIESPVIPSEVAERDSLGAYKKGVASFHEAFPDLRYTIEHIVGEGDKVGVDYVLNATHTGSTFAGIAPSGKKIESPQLCYTELTNGKIKLLRFCSYGAPMLAQLQG